MGEFETWWDNIRSKETVPGKVLGWDERMDDRLLPKERRRLWKKRFPNFAGPFADSSSNCPQALRLLQLGKASLRDPKCFFDPEAWARKENKDTLGMRGGVLRLGFMELTRTKTHRTSWCGDRGNRLGT